MKERTIQELHDPKIGHRKFAKVCDLLVINHRVTDIKEFNEKFKFKVDGFEFQYDKNWKSSAKEYVDYLLHLLNFKRIIDIYA